MKGSTHLTGGLLVGVILSGSPLGLSVAWPISLAAATLASLIPDWLQINLPGANNVVHGVVGHRGFTHWLVTSGAIGIAAWVLAPQVAACIVGGWLMHIVLDLFSGGTTLLWPVTTHRICLANIKTGGRLDTFIGAWMLVMATLLFIRRIL